MADGAYPTAVEMAPPPPALTYPTPLPTPPSYGGMPPPPARGGCGGRFVAVAPDSVLLTVGTDFRTSEYVDRLASTSDATTTSEAPSLTAVPATAAGSEAPTPTNLTLMTAGSVPCVR